MESNNKFHQSLYFVATHWRKDSFLVDSALKCLGLEDKRKTMWRRVAAAVTVVTILGMSAAIYFSYNQSATPPAPAPAEKESPAVLPSESPLERNKRIEFVDATLAEVALEIEHTYGVKIENIPDDGIRLTLSYEGNAPDLIDTINELLGTHLTLKE